MPVSGDVEWETGGRWVRGREVIPPPPCPNDMASLKNKEKEDMRRGWGLGEVEGREVNGSEI